MAEIAEKLLLLLLDNASAQPRLDRLRRERVLTAAVLLDLAHACRIRPAVDDEPVEAGRLVVLTGPDSFDPVTAPALQMLLHRPMTPAAAIAKLRKVTPGAVLAQLEHSGQVQRVRPHAKGLKGPYSWPLADRTRVARTRAALQSALFDRHCPDPTTATIITLLYMVDGLGAVFSLNGRGWEWVRNRAGDIASGSWVGESEPEIALELATVNLAVTTAAVRQALT